MYIVVSFFGCWLKTLFCFIRALSQFFLCFPTPIQSGNAFIAKCINQTNYDLEISRNGNFQYAEKKNPKFVIIIQIQFKSINPNFSITIPFVLLVRLIVIHLKVAIILYNNNWALFSTPVSFRIRFFFLIKILLFTKFADGK